MHCTGCKLRWIEIPFQWIEKALKGCFKRKSIHKTISIRLNLKPALQNSEVQSWGGLLGQVTHAMEAKQNIGTKAISGSPLQG